MSDLTISLQVNYSKNGRTLSVNPGLAEIDVTGNGMVDGVILITFAAAMALPLGGVATPGIAVITNLDAANYVELGVDDSGLVPYVTIPAGETAMVNLGNMAVPYMQADTGNCLVSYTIFSA